MKNLICRQVEVNEDTICVCENVRYDAYNMKGLEIDVSQTHYACELRQDKYVVLGAYLGDILVGACYVSKKFDSLFIEHLFVKRQFQKSNLHVGTNLLSYVLNNKHIIEQYFEKKFLYSYLDTRNELVSFCEQFGYASNHTMMMKKTFH